MCYISLYTAFTQANINWTDSVHGRAQNAKIPQDNYLVLIGQPNTVFQLITHLALEQRVAGSIPVKYIKFYFLNFAAI
jgi:hypothetical protein